MIAEIIDQKCIGWQREVFGGLSSVIESIVRLDDGTQRTTWTVYTSDGSIGMATFEKPHIDIAAEAIKP